MDQLIALGLTEKSFWKPARRPSLSLVSETGMFLRMPSPLTSDGPLLSLLCSPRARHFLRLLVGVAD